MDGGSVSLRAKWLCCNGIEAERHGCVDANGCRPRKWLSTTAADVRLSVALDLLGRTGSARLHLWFRFGALTTVPEWSEA